jgi:hypothetical protein
LQVCTNVRTLKCFGSEPLSTSFIWEPPFWNWHSLRLKKANFSLAEDNYVTYTDTNTPMLGCQIFLGTTCQSGTKYTKWQQNMYTKEL